MRPEFEAYTWSPHDPWFMILIIQLHYLKIVSDFGQVTSLFNPISILLIYIYSYIIYIYDAERNSYSTWCYGNKHFMGSLLLLFISNSNNIVVNVNSNAFIKHCKSHHDKEKCLINTLMIMVKPPVPAGSVCSERAPSLI